MSSRQATAAANPAGNSFRGTWYLGLMLVFTWSFAAAYAETDPREVIEGTTNEMISVIRENRQALSDDSNLIYGYVSEIIIPHLDFVTASRYILGKHWRTATEEQRARFAEEFKTMLVRTYGKALLEYNNERLEFFPSVINEKDPTRATVRAAFHQPGTNPIDIRYRMHKRNGPWQVWDVSIGGVSVVENFRKGYDGKISNSERGLDGVIEDLAAQNSRGS